MGTDAVGDVLRIDRIVLVVGSEGLLVPVHPAGVEQVEPGLVSRQDRILVELAEGGQPVVAGGLGGDIQLLKALLGHGLRQPVLDLLVPRQGIGEAAVTAHVLPLRVEQSQVEVLQANIDANK